MKNGIQQQPLILASQSPRRKYLLEQAGLVFEVIPSHFDEESVTLGEPAAYARTLAIAKAEEIAGKFPTHWVIGADTIVLIDGMVLGKPTSRASAKRMLERLSGQTHHVLTGYAICFAQNNICISDVVETDVTFKQLSEDEIEWYTHTKEPFDKAGAYAIQGLGTFLVQRINGSYTNVVGLPVCEVIETLINHGAIQMINGTSHVE